MKNKLFFYIILTAFITQIVSVNGVFPEPDPIFELTLISPYGGFDLIAQEWEKLSISTEIIHLSYPEIGTRVWDYPFSNYSYIPTYIEGGYDLVIIGYTHPNYVNLGNLFSEDEIIPEGINYSQFNNTDFETALDSFVYEQNLNQRLQYYYELQRIIHEEVPSIGIINDADFFAFNENLVGINPNLLRQRNHRIEYWDDPFDHIINVAIAYYFNQHNPFKHFIDVDNLWMRSVYGSLLKPSHDNIEFEPYIAENYSMSSDMLTITVDIDKNARFSDNNSVLAEDVKYSYEFYNDPNLDHYSYFSRFFENNDAFEIIDLDTIRFHLKEIVPCFQELLTYGIIDKSRVEPVFVANGYSIFDSLALSGAVNDSLVTSCGPYKLVEYSTNSAKLIPNPYWHGIFPDLNEINIIYLESNSDYIAEISSGNIDILDYMFCFQPEDIDAISGVKPVLAEKLYIYQLILNQKHPIIGTGELTPLGSKDAVKKIRQALNHAIPRQDIVNDKGGFATPGIIPIPSACVYFNSNLQAYSYNLSLAENLLKEAGYLEGKSGPTTPTKSNFPNLVFIIVLYSVCYLCYKKRKRK